MNETTIEKARRLYKEVADKFQAWADFLKNVDEDSLTEDETEEIETLTIKFMLKMKKIFGED